MRHNHLRAKDDFGIEYGDAPRQHSLTGNKPVTQDDLALLPGRNRSSFFSFSPSRETLGEETYKPGLYKLILAINQRNLEGIRAAFTCEEHPTPDERKTVSMLESLSASVLRDPKNPEKEKLLPKDPVKWAFDLYHTNPTYASDYSYLHELVHNLDKVNQLTNTKTTIDEIREYAQKLNNPTLISITLSAEPDKSLERPNNPGPGPGQTAG